MNDIELMQHRVTIELEAERFKKLIEHWCPTNLLHEGMPNALMRAFMQATACCADQKRKLDGLEPIRPLESYPDPMQGFQNTPTGFVTITIPEAVVEFVVKGIMENFPEASQGCALRCTDWHYDQWKFTFVDGENGTVYELDKAKLLAAFPLIFTDKWPNGCTRPPGSDKFNIWDDWLCQADAQDFDAFAQLACLGEVIYG